MADIKSNVMKKENDKKNSEQNNDSSKKVDLKQLLIEMKNFQPKVPLTFYLASIKARRRR